MLPDRVLNPGPLTYESGALPIALRGPAPNMKKSGKVLLLENCGNCGPLESRHTKLTFLKRSLSKYYLM